MKQSKLIYSLSILLAVVAITLTSYSCRNRSFYVMPRLYGYWNMVIDSLVVNRSTVSRFSSINFNFSDKKVELPLVEQPSVDLKGKTLLDKDINQDSLRKSDLLFEKAKSDAIGTFSLLKDSIRITAPHHPFNGTYKITFYKVNLYGQEHYLMRLSNDSTYIVCEKFFSGFVNHKLLREWGEQP